MTVTFLQLPICDTGEKGYDTHVTKTSTQRNTHTHTQTRSHVHTYTHPHTCAHTLTRAHTHTQTYAEESGTKDHLLARAHT